MNLNDSTYVGLDMSQHHFMSLLDLIAFGFYPGSYLFLVGCLFASGAFAAGIEVATFTLGGANLILCSLVAQVGGYHDHGLGYVPT